MFSNTEFNHLKLKLDQLYLSLSGGKVNGETVFSKKVTFGSGDKVIKIHDGKIEGLDFPEGHLLGTCTTAAATAAKVVTLTDASGWELKQGATICIKFTNTNTAQNPTLNVNNSGAKSIYYNRALITTDSLWVAGENDRYTTFMYDGTYWVWIGSSIDRNTTYSNMSTSELTTGTATTSRVVRADYLKTGITSLINSNSYKRFSSSWVYNVKIVSSNASGQIVWVFAPCGYIILTTAGKNIGINTAWLSNISKWTYSKSGLTITFNTTDHSPIWVVASDNKISVTFTDTSTPQSNTFSNWVPSNATLATYISESDTRNDNQNPQWYMTNSNKRIVTEFKATSTIGVDSIISSGVYCTLLTIVPWDDSSGGLPYQIALSPSGIAAYRVASSKTGWGAWTRIYTTDTTKGNDITTNAAKTGSGTTVTSTIAANTSMDNAIGTLLNNDVALNASLANKQDKLTNPLTKSDVVNNLTTTTTNVPLSAAQGKVLNDKISNMKGVVISTVEVAANTTTNIVTSAGQYLLFATSTTNKYRSITFANIHATDNNVCYSSKFVENHDGNGGTMTVYTTANLLSVSCTVKCRVRVMRIGSSNY